MIFLAQNSCTFILVAFNLIVVYLGQSLCFLLTLVNNVGSSINRNMTLVVDPSKQKAFTAIELCRAIP